MLRLTLRRFLSDDEGTLGTLFHGNREICLIAELPWRDNRSNLSHIPPGPMRVGTYLVKYLERSASGKYRDVYHVQGVPGRGGILTHAGNFTGDTTKGLRADSWGCLLPGKRAGRLGGQRAVLASRGALADIHAITNRQSFELEIIDHA